MPPGGIIDTSIPESGGESPADAVDMADLAETQYTGTAWYAENLQSVEIVEDLGGPAGGFGGPGGGGSGGNGSGGGDEQPQIDWSTATATIRAWGTDGLSWFERETTTTPDADGSFTVDLDFSAVDPGTPFQVVAIVEETVVYSATGRVVADGLSTNAQSVLETDCPNLQQLLWLRARQPLFGTDDGPSSDLSGALSQAAFDAMQAERDAADPSTTPITTDDVDAVDDLLAVEGIDPTGLADHLATAVGPISKLGLDRIVDVVGKGGPGDVDVWYGPTAALSDVRARLTRTLADPSLYNDGAAPWLLSYDQDSAAVLHGMEHGDEVAAYLDAFCSAPPWLLRYIDEQIEEPVTLLQELTAWLYDPSAVENPGDLPTALQHLASVATELPALAVPVEGLPTIGDNSQLETFQTHLQDLAAEIGSSSPSLPDPSTAKSTFDAELSSSTTALASDANSVATAIDPVVGSEADRAFRRIVLEQLREPMTVAASYGVFGSTPRSPDGGRPNDEAALLEQARALLERLRTRLSDAAPLDPRAATDGGTQPVPQRVEAQTDRLEALFGDDFTVLPPFMPSNGPELATTFTDDGLIPNDESMAAETLLQRTAAFRETVGDFREARTYAEAIAGTLTEPLTIGQVPYEPGDTWVGVDDVDPDSGKLSLVAQFGPDVTPGSVDRPITGLFLDEWTEAIPADSETSGVALNYDDPGNRPPQSLLVATPPADGEWTLSDLAATVAETAEYMKRRAVDMGDLEEASYLFPGLYFARQDDATPSTPTVNFEMLDWYDRQLEATLLGPQLSLELGGWSFDG